MAIEFSTQYNIWHAVTYSRLLTLTETKPRPAGVELAGEIATDCPGKTITLVHSADRLLNGRPEGVSKAAQRFLEKKGVKVSYLQLYCVVKGLDH